MVETQCEQIVSGYQFFLQDDINILVSTNVVTRREAVVTGPLGPPEYEAEKERREKAVLEAIQEDDTLVDSQYEIVQATQDSTLEVQDDAQGDPYDSDVEIVDPREKNEATNEEEEVIVVKKKKNDKQQQQKKMTKEPDPPQKVKDKQSKGEKKLPYPE